VKQKSISAAMLVIAAALLSFSFFHIYFEEMINDTFM